MRLLTFLIILILSCSGVDAFAQIDSTDPGDSIIQVDPIDVVKPGDSIIVPQVIKVDTILYQPIGEKPTAIKVTNPVNLEEHLTQQPTKALFKSLFVPGWGQIGNKKYLKAAVIIVLESRFISEAIKHGSDASNAYNNWKSSTDLNVRRSFYTEYEIARENRNKNYWYAGITIFISMFDAYVDAHLSGSPIDFRIANFSFEAGPDDNGGGMVQIAFRF